MINLILKKQLYLVFFKFYMSQYLVKSNSTNMYDREVLTVIKTYDDWFYLEVKSIKRMEILRYKCDQLDYSIVLKKNLI